MPDLAAPLCPKCRSRRTSRVKRNGFFQTVVLPYLDRYPWECSACRSVFAFKSRGRLKSAAKSASEASRPAATNEIDQPAMSS